MSELRARTCKPCEGGIPALTRSQAKDLLMQIPTWTLNDAATEIHRDFKFKNFYETIAFVNALAWICNTEDHHPDLHVTYDRCVVRFNTHSVNGVSINDFICAAKADGLVSFIA